jgi:glycosyltransferase involved in cell wall biosynthesis
VKVLALSNFYPPYYVGGEELSARSIVLGLRQRGHEVEVLTSDYGSSANEDHVYRQLKLEMDFKPLRNALHFFISRNKVIRENVAVLERQLQRFDPDLLLIFSLWNIPRQVSAAAERLFDGRVVYRLASYWPTLPSQYDYYWQTPAKSTFAKLPKAILSSIAQKTLKQEQVPTLHLKHAVCISQAVHDEFIRKGVRLTDVRIIHNGIDVKSFYNEAPSWLQGVPSSPLRLLYVGRISSEKGVHTAVEAVAMLQGDFPGISLTVAGSSWGSAAHGGVLELAANLGVLDKVSVRGHVSHADIPALMQSHHVLVVPSIWPEPFGRVVLEGMAAGLVVIGTAQGGMGVVLRDGETGLVFPPKDAGFLSQQIKRLLTEEQLGRKLIRTAQAMVSSNFTEDKMVSEYEAYLESILL